MHGTMNLQRNYYLQIAHVTGHSRRDVALPTINVLDPLGTINSFNSFILNSFGGLSKVDQNATSMAEESKKAVESLVVSVVDSTKNNVETVVNRAAADIWTAVNNSAIGTAIRIQQCWQKGMLTVAGDAFQTGKSFFCSLDHAFSNYDEGKTNEMNFQSKPYI
jgi:hypothetical protein